ncbi:MAG: hypothetical protein M1501_01725 [Candidatus Omnitrophica bacterium]|nr:hypothetical protein [Candidatus Omnitrophota bacterium]
MKMILLCLLIIILSITSFAFTAQANSSKVIFACFITKPPVIGVSLKNQCWREANIGDNFLQYVNQDKSVSSDMQTRFSVLYDQKNIYIMIYCKGKMEHGIKKTPAGQWPNGDVIEIFLDPGLTRSKYYQFAANPQGGSYAGFGPIPKNYDWQTFSCEEKDGWMMEVRIPWSSLSSLLPKDGEIWGINICRDYGGVPFSTWMGVGLYFAQPGDFGFLVFGNQEQWWRKEFPLYCRDAEMKIERFLKRTNDISILHRFEAIRISYIRLMNRPHPDFSEAETILTHYQDIIQEIKWISAMNQKP